MNVRRWIALAGFASTLIAWARAPLAASDEWTPDRVRAFVLRAEVEMLHLASEQLKAKPAFKGTCHGSEVYVAVKKSVAMPRIQGLVTGKALSCYVASYLGCSQGDSIARSNDLIMIRRPFTRAKVTIIERTTDRVVADVTEASTDDVAFHVDAFHLDARVVEGDDDSSRPYTDAEVAAVKDVSRYTITRGSDGVWRISDRKPTFKWICEDSSVVPLRK